MIDVCIVVITGRWGHHGRADPSPTAFPLVSLQGRSLPARNYLLFPASRGFYLCEVISHYLFLLSDPPCLFLQVLTLATL